MPNSSSEPVRDGINMEFLRRVSERLEVDTLLYIIRKGLVDRYVL